jgi:hypothetical protein
VLLPASSCVAAVPAQHAARTHGGAKISTRPRGGGSGHGHAFQGAVLPVATSLAGGKSTTGGGMISFGGADSIFFDQQSYDERKHTADGAVTEHAKHVRNSDHAHALDVLRQPTDLRGSASGTRLPGGYGVIHQRVDRDESTLSVPDDSGDLHRDGAPDAAEPTADAQCFDQSSRAAWVYLVGSGYCQGATAFRDNAGVCNPPEGSRLAGAVARVAPSSLGQPMCPP